MMALVDVRHLRGGDWFVWEDGFGQSNLCVKLGSPWSTGSLVQAVRLRDGALLHLEPEDSVQRIPWRAT
jgi:hypothetical protein